MVCYDIYGYGYGFTRKYAVGPFGRWVTSMLCDDGKDEKKSISQGFVYNYFATNPLQTLAFSPSTMR
jgi:hypothetical protein